jgi:hypothetical protein
MVHPYDDDNQSLPRRADGPRGRPPASARHRENFVQRRLEGRDDDLYEPEPPDDEPAAVAPYVAGYAPLARRQIGCATATLYVLLAVVALALLGVFLVPRVLGNMAAAVPERVVQIIATPTPTVRDRGGTIQQIQALNRLETQRFAIERVVEANVQRGNVLDLLLGERLLLIASGEVIAGVDLSKLKPSDVTISADGESITINLPKSEIFAATLDNTRTKVYDKQTRILTRLTGGENKDLETQARQKAQDEVLRAACEGGVMQRAADEARRSMEQFLRLLEFSQINVNAPAGECVAPGSGAPPATPTP